MKNGFIIDYDTVAALLANDDDHAQSSFFRVFLKELRKCCKTAHNMEMQLTFISNKLNSEELELVRFLGYESPPKVDD